MYTHSLCVIHLPCTHLTPFCQTSQLVDIIRGEMDWVLENQASLQERIFNMGFEINFFKMIILVNYFLPIDNKINIDLNTVQNITRHLSQYIFLSIFITIFMKTISFSMLQGQTHVLHVNNVKNVLKMRSVIGVTSPSRVIHIRFLVTYHPHVAGIGTSNNVTYNLLLLLLSCR